MSTSTQCFMKTGPLLLDPELNPCCTVDARSELLHFVSFILFSD
uniref:Uncharacterized protein n=1 Tax=Anguilla anguilla TaxID=7936 RepID=A0A0E9TMZ6_ANGAN